MRKIITMFAAGITGTLLALTIPAGGAGAASHPAAAPTSAHARADHLVNRKRCLSASGNGRVSVQLCDWTDHRQDWRPVGPLSANTNHVVTMGGKCLTATSSHAVMLTQRCDGSNDEQWLTILPVAISLIESARYPSLCLAGPVHGLYGDTRLVSCESSDAIVMWTQSRRR